MALTLAEVKHSLLAGNNVSWGAFEKYKSGSIVLDTPGKRRLFEFLLGADASRVREGHESLFDGLLASWRNESYDPASAISTDTVVSTSDIWLLKEIRTSCFGGLNLDGTTEFMLDVAGDNWCIEGQNGSGKTSLASAILWALTGHRIREHVGPVLDNGTRFPVFDEAGSPIGEWPPLAVYPATQSELSKTAEVTVQLKFENNNGDIALAIRKSTSPATGTPIVDEKIDARLLAAPQLIETGLLMPCRLAHMGFGEQSQSLYEAVKLLTGLDQLADIADGAAAFSNAARRFLKYAKDQGIDAKQKTFDDNIAGAIRVAQQVSLELAGLPSLDTIDGSALLRAKASELSNEAGQHLETLKADIASEIDTNKTDGRVRIKTAVDNARGKIQQKADGIPVFAAWVALKNAPSQEQFQRLPAELQSAEMELSVAIQWHQRQTDDAKLRLKALAAEWFTPIGEPNSAACPLCDSKLVTAEQMVLAQELEELKQEAAVAERKLTDVCTGLESRLLDLLPKDMRTHLPLLEDMEPRRAYVEAVSARFVNEPPFSNTLVGLAKCIRKLLDDQNQSLPEFIYTIPNTTPLDEPAVAQQIRIRIAVLRRLYTLADWWGENRDAFRVAWGAVLGEAASDGSYPTNSVQGQVRLIEQALSSAEPFDEVARNLKAAADASDSWQKIREEQKVREAIRDNIEPLKGLRSMVETETARSIGTLSSKIQAVLKRIHHRERLEYRDTALKKKAVYVHGGFSDGIKIDAALVANTSWLRAILWAFIIALREETMATMGTNSFPLVVLDDPQMTFDPRNKRKWAQELVRVANLEDSNVEAVQLFLTTHEREFFTFLTDCEKLSGQQGVMAGADPISGVATVVNGSSLQRQWQDANLHNDDARAREYVRLVRIHIEKLLKVMLRSVGPNIQKGNLDTLRRELSDLKKRSIHPFDGKSFENLSNSLDGGAKAVRLLNGPPHSDDATIGIAEASDVHEFWENQLRSRLYEAFDVFSHFEAHQGDPRIFNWQPTVVDLPERHRDELKKLRIVQTGIAAAAKTDGRVGNGLVAIEQWEADKLTEVRLYNHEIYQLAAGTLEPVAAIGDLIIISNYAPVKARDLVVAAFGDSRIARRMNEANAHPNVYVLTGQSVDPTVTPQPIIVPREAGKFKKIVGTIFSFSGGISPQPEANDEIVVIDDSGSYINLLSEAKLFKVKGRSAEPVALDGQFLVTRDPIIDEGGMRRLDGQLVVATDESGATYFKRLRLARESAVILESLNPDGTSPAELLSLNGENGTPRLVSLIPVVGVLFELPQ